MACSTDANGNYYSQELAMEQTLDKLQLFSDKLQFIYANYMKRET